MCVERELAMDPSSEIVAATETRVEDEAIVGQKGKNPTIIIEIDLGELSQPNANIGVPTVTKISADVTSTEVEKDFDDHVRVLRSEFLRLRNKLIVDGRLESCARRMQTLSDKQGDVLILILQGKSCKEIAARMNIGLATAAKHRAHIFEKLNVRSAVELVQILGMEFEMRETRGLPLGSDHKVLSNHAVSLAVNT